MDNLDRTNNKNVSLELIAEYGGSDSESDETEKPSTDTPSDDQEESMELSAMVLKNNIINACAHGPLSGSASGLDDEDQLATTRHMIIDSAESGIVEYEVTEYRDIESDSDDSSDSSSDAESIKQYVEEMFASDDDEVRMSKPSKTQTLKVAGEMGLEDLPPIEDLAISLPEQETTHIGTIANIVDKLVIVRGMPGSPAVDLDSVLFLDKGAKALGKVFDVFGPVTEPHYCVRFNSSEHASERGARPGAYVYIAPKSQHTNYVFLSELMKIKGSDASWKDDVEPPLHQLDYSDDEQERNARRSLKEPKETKDNALNNSRKKQEHRKPHRQYNRFSNESTSQNPTFRKQFAMPRFSNPWDQNDPGGRFGQFPPNPYPPFMAHSFQFGAAPRVGHVMPPFRQNGPLFGPHFMRHPQWMNGPPPPPGT